MIERTALKIRTLIGLGCLMMSAAVSSFEHDHSLVDFTVYSDNVIQESRQQGKPYFLLFSAEWCHWCHEFAEHTLTRQDVADYLNENYVNIFIDVDIENSAYVKYHATGLPFTVFLNPDGSLYYRYTGTLYGDDFLDVVKEVAAEAGSGKYALGMESTHVSYDPPQSLDESSLSTLPEYYIEGLLENFDPDEYGLGKGQKSLQPRAFMYLLENTGPDDREDSIDWITGTLEHAVASIYDPVEGGFFRYAETRDWQIPHYEKFADLNAGIALLIYKLNEQAPSPDLVAAAEKTLEHLNSTLYHPETGAYLSFQVAHTSYYLLGEKYRQNNSPPKVMDKIFAGRLALTLSYLMELSDYRKDAVIKQRISDSLEFLATMIMSGEGMNRYYSLESSEWHAESGLSDHAYAAGLFASAASRFDDPRYAAVAAKILRSAAARFYDANGSQTFIDPTVDAGTNVEYLMEMNGRLVQAMLDLGDRLDPDLGNLVDPVIAYYSGMVDVLDERFWNGVDWDFAETYVPFMHSIESWNAAREKLVAQP